MFGSDAAPGSAARGQPRCHGENIGTVCVAGGTGEIGTRQKVAVRNLPLDSKIAGPGRIQLDNQRFDIDLRTTRVELVDHGTQIAIHGVRRGDDERVRRCIGLNHAARLVLVVVLALLVAQKAAVVVGTASSAAARAQQRTAASAERAAAVRRGQRRDAARAGRHRAAALIERVRVVRFGARRTFSRPFAHHAAQGLCKLHRIRVAQMHDMHVARLGTRGVELLRKLLGHRQPRLVRCAQQEGICARIGRDRYLQRCIGIADRAGIEQLRELLRHIDGVGVLQRNDLDLAARRVVDTGDDRRDAPDVVGIVGNDESIVGWIGPRWCCSAK